MRIAAFIAAVIIFFTALFVPISKSHAAQCGPYTEAVEILGRVHSEAPILQALDSKKNLVVLFQTLDGATWTLLVASPDGRSCLVGAGTDIEFVEWVDPKPVAEPQSF